MAEDLCPEVVPVSMLGRLAKSSAKEALRGRLGDGGACCCRSSLFEDMLEAVARRLRQADSVTPMR